MRKNRKNITYLFGFATLIVGVVVIASFSANIEATSQPPMTNNAKTFETTLLRAPRTDIPGLKRMAQVRGISVEREFPLSNDESALVLSAPQGVVNLQLSQPLLSGGTEAFPNYQYRIQTAPSDPEYSPDTATLSDGQWNLEKIHAEAGWEITKGSEDITIAIIDSGILFNQSWGKDQYAQEYAHTDMPEDRMWVNPNEELDGQDTSGNGYVDDINGWDFMGGWVGSEDCPNYEEGVTEDTYTEQDNDPQPYSCDSPNYPTELNKNHYDGTCQAFESACYVGHGTAVASVATALTNNEELIAGIDWNAKIMNLRVFDGYGYTTSDRIVAAIDYAVDNGADVINLSLAVFSNGSCTPEDAALEAALKRAHDAGVVSIAASGNGGGEGACYPANSQYTIAVGATNKDDQRSSFSTYGDSLDLMAPGELVPALSAPSAYTDGAPSCPQANFCFSSGTSLSTPHVTGVVAGIKSIDSGISPESVRKTLHISSESVEEMEGSNKTKEYGYGRLNAEFAYDPTYVKEFNNIRLFSCNGEPHLVERNIRHKRLITPTAMKHWGFEGLYIKEEEKGCSYPSYTLPLDRIVRSRNTGKEYLVDYEKAQWIHTQSAADSWGISNYRSETYPQFNGKSIKTLQVNRSLPEFIPSLDGASIRLFKCGEQEYLVERNIRNARFITQDGLGRWGLEGAYFKPEDDGRGCSYNVYNYQLEDVIRSRNTGKEYLVMDSRAYRISDEEAALSWGVAEYEDTVYPQFNGDSIHYLEVMSNLPVKE